MSRNIPPSSGLKYKDLPLDQQERHTTLLDIFGQWLFWHRNQSLETTRLLIESEEARGKIGSIHRKDYEGVADMTADQRAAAMALAKRTLDGFLEQLVWSLGDEGVDCKFDEQHAYRFGIEIEIVRGATGDLVDKESVNRGGQFFGKNWGRWLNRFGLR